MTETNNTVSNITTNDEYAKQVERWDIVFDTLQDETHIKNQTTKYLPMPSGILAEKDTTLRTALYNAYLSKAIYYRYLNDFVVTMKSLLMKKPPEIVLPEKLEPILENAGQDGDNLLTVINRLFQAQLSYSRYGILVDIPDNAKGIDIIPHLIEYNFSKIKNWIIKTVDGKKKTVAIVLDESYSEMGIGFNETNVIQYRICALANYKSKPLYYSYRTDIAGVNAFDVEQDISEGVIPPNILEKTLDYIPFQICNALSLDWETEIPIGIAVSDISLAIYRGEADYRQGLFMQGQATPYATGATTEKDSLNMGASALVRISSSEAKVGFMEVEGKGLGAMAAGLDGLHKQNERLGISLIDAGANQSGEALGVRLGIQTASLAGVSQTNKACMTILLKICADWMGLDAEEVSLNYYTDFASAERTIEELEKTGGLVGKSLFALEDYYRLLVKNEQTNVATFEEWKEMVESQTSLMIDSATQAIIDEANADNEVNDNIDEEE